MRPTRSRRNTHTPPPSQVYISQTLGPTSHYLHLPRARNHGRHRHTQPPQTPHARALLLTHLPRNRLLPAHRALQRGLRKRHDERHPSRAVQHPAPAQNRGHAYDLRHRPAHPRRFALTDASQSDTGFVLDAREWLSYWWHWAEHACGE